MRRFYYLTSVASLMALIFLTLAWELVLAPLHSGGSSLVLKALLLCLPLRGILQQRLFTYRWASMFILAFFAEGVMRVYSEHGLSQSLAALEVLFTVVFYGAVLGFIYDTQRIPRSHK